jgi:hypothetical protein
MSEDRHRSDEAELLAAHRERLAGIAPIIASLPEKATAADQRRANRHNAARAVAVAASCREYAKAVHDLMARRKNGGA